MQFMLPFTACMEAACNATTRKQIKTKFCASHLEFFLQCPVNSTDEGNDATPVSANDFRM